MTRPISAIAREIERDWTEPYFGAIPYLDAMHHIDSIDGMFYLDSAENIVRCFLSNASSWRGPVARRVKVELRAILKGTRR